MHGILDCILPKVTKPARYTDSEWNSLIKDWDRVKVRLVLAFPDIYEVGMSNLGLAILYDLVNQRPDALAERVFAPWPDMARAMREHSIPLFSLESRRPLADFDIIGFSLGYEQTYTNVLEMLALAGLPVLASERTDSHPLIIAGGSCSLNAEPMADFIDLFVLGEGEEVLNELIDLYRELKPVTGRMSRAEFLRAAVRVPGVYVPSLYHVDYHPDGTVASIQPREPDAPRRVRRRMMTKLPPPVTRPVVPYLEVVHDRGVVEIMRGCTRGCRFCQAGTIYRPLRQRSQDEVLRAVDELIKNTGYSEISLLSLSSSDYDGLPGLVKQLAARHGTTVAISLPSLRIDRMSVELAEAVAAGRRKTSFTFAVEAGSQRLRDVINKGITEEAVLATADTVFSHGWRAIKFYFMVGLPTETEDDVQGIVDLVRKVYQLGRRHAGSHAQLRVSVSTFVPKPHTPFQWVGQDRPEMLERKHSILRRGLRGPGIELSWHDPNDSLLEATLSRGDRRLGRVIYRAWQEGCIFDAWSELFHFDRWMEAFQAEGLDPGFYAYRERPMDEVLPWSHLDAGVTPAFLQREYARAMAASTTPDCHYGDCSTCGLHRFSIECRSRAGRKGCNVSA